MSDNLHHLRWLAFRAGGSIFWGSVSSVVEEVGGPTMIEVCASDGGDNRLACAGGKARFVEELFWRGVEGYDRPPPLKLRAVCLEVGSTWRRGSIDREWRG